MSKLVQSMTSVVSAVRDQLLQIWPQEKLPSRNVHLERMTTWLKYVEEVTLEPEHRCASLPETLKDVRFDLNVVVAQSFFGGPKRCCALGAFLLSPYSVQEGLAPTPDEDGDICPVMLFGKEERYFKDPLFSNFFGIEHDGYVQIVDVDTYPNFFLTERHAHREEILARMVTAIINAFGIEAVPPLRIRPQTLTELLEEVVAA